VMQRIRQMEGERRVPLDRRLPSIALTGHARQQDRLTALMAGFQLHLAKPVDPTLLARSLAALAGRVVPDPPAGGAPPAQANDQPPA
jgi:ATP-binding cassette subfamily B protein